MFIETHDGEDMFEPAFIDRPLESVRDDVDGVRQEFGDCLREDDMGREELECLSLLLERSGDGDYQDTARIGSELLEKVQAKLKTAAEDLQRFDGESAAASNTTGRRVDRLTKAAAVIMNARERLQEIAKA
jgi:hypothetical protein